MPQTDLAPTDTHQEFSHAAPEEQFTQIMQALGKLFERITPWLLDFDIWIFGGLIAFSLLVIAALIPVGPVDPAITVATAAFALALPLNVAGLFLLKLVQDLKHVGFEEELTQAFQEVGFIFGEQSTTSKAFEAARKRRARIVLLYSLCILALSIVLTLTGMMAVLWHMAWWIGVAFFAMVVISLVIVIVAIVTSQPPDSEEWNERMRRSREEITRQAKAQYKKNEEQF